MSLFERIAVPVVSLALCTQPADGARAPAAQTTVRPAAVGEMPTGVDATSAAGGVVPPIATNPSVARSTRLLQHSGYAASRGSLPVLVIPAKEMGAETSRRIVEDLSIMSRIIEKSLWDTPDERFGFTIIGKLQRDLLLPSDGAGPRVLHSSSGRPKPVYLGGYGAIFSLQVDLPLVPPPGTPEPNKAAEQMDQVWAQAQRELLDPQAALHVQPGAPQGKPYSAEAVESLRSTLIASLKHATNIRDLEPETWLVILVQGPAPTGQAQVRDPGYVQEYVPAGPGDTGRTVLTLRATKADIDQYAKGQLDETQFQQRVQVVTY